jgi:hypothetical protein
MEAGMDGLRAIGWLGLILCTAGCGSNSVIGPGTCSVTLSGAITATATCQLAAATSASAAGKVSFGLEGQTGGTTVTFSSVLNLTTLQTGTYGSSTGTSPSMAGGSVTTTAGASWLQFTNTSGVADRGSFTLIISSTGASVPSGQYTGWPDPGGSLDFILTPVTGTGATGTVTVHVVF